LLWEEYRQSNPDGYQYNRFCELYRRWRRKQDVVLRQEHKAGEKLFVDWAGTTIPIHDPRGGPVQQAHLFVAVLRASSYITPKPLPRSSCQAGSAPKFAPSSSAKACRNSWCLTTPRPMLPKPAAMIPTPSYHLARWSLLLDVEPPRHMRGISNRCFVAIRQVSNIS
jgi:hypothetical protein